MFSRYLVVVLGASFVNENCGKFGVACPNWLLVNCANDLALASPFVGFLRAVDLVF